MAYNNPKINDIDFTAIALFDVISDATTSRTLSLADAACFIRFSNAATATVTIPTQATVTWDANVEILFEQSGAGTVSFTGAGVTINAKGTKNTSGQYAVVALKRVASDTWTLFGDLQS